MNISPAILRVSLETLLLKSSVVLRPNSFSINSIFKASISSENKVEETEVMQDEVDRTDA